jgi:hypothetical protein
MQITAIFDFLLFILYAIKNDTLYSIPLGQSQKTMTTLEGYMKPLFVVALVVRLVFPKTLFVSFSHSSLAFHYCP